MSPVRCALLLLLWPADALFAAQAGAPGAPPRYHTQAVIAATITKQFRPPQIAILEKLNRRDLEHLIRLTEMIVPDEWLDDELAYSPLPATWAWAESMPKVHARGVSFHQFELPGHPASHACVRLLEPDARWVYAWGEQWKLSADGRDVVQPGSTVVILGAYDFSRPAPWLLLDWWHTPMDLATDPAQGPR